jgi:hypothetical protein
LNILNFFLAEDTEQKWPVGNWPLNISSETFWNHITQKFWIEKCPRRAIAIDLLMIASFADDICNILRQDKEFAMKIIPKSCLRSALHSKMYSKLSLNRQNLHLRIFYASTSSRWRNLPRMKTLCPQP